MRLKTSKTEWFSFHRWMNFTHHSFMFALSMSLIYGAVHRHASQRATGGGFFTAYFGRQVSFTLRHDKSTQQAQNFRRSRRERERELESAHTVGSFVALRNILRFLSSPRPYTASTVSFLGFSLNMHFVRCWIYCKSVGKKDAPFELIVNIVDNVIAHFVW